VSGRYEDDETIPEYWRPRRDPPPAAPAAPADDTARMAPVSPTWSPAPPPRPPRRFPAAAAGLLAALAVLVGVAIGHDLWNTSTPAATVAQTGIVPGQVAPTLPNIPGSGGGSVSSGGSGSAGSAGSGSPAGSGGSGSSAGSGSSSNASGASSASTESIASKVDPALVDINSTFFDAKGAGTGIVLTANGEILTNNHVIDGASTISVTDIGNGKTYTGTVVGYDSPKDIAVVQLQGASGLQTAKLGNSSTAAAGDPIVAIGNAGGTGGTPSTAAGSITALNQSITAGNDLDGTSEQLAGLIEVDADVEAGDSGGSLVNSAGQVIGVDTAASEGFSFRSAQTASQGFAIPINQALALASQIESGQSSTEVHVGPTAFLGVEVDVGSEPASQGGGGFGGGYYGGGYGGYGGGGGSAASTTSGAAIGGVINGDAAEKAGLVAGDTVTSLNGQPVDSAGTLTKLITGLKPGQTVSIGWTDAGGQSHTGTVDLGTGPPA
jgi:S1-C subfamily serine protease